MWKGSTNNVHVEWENGEITNDPMTTIAANDPVTCAIYAKENSLLDVPGWKAFKSIARRQQHMFCMANQAKLRSFRLAPKYKYGFEILQDYKQAIGLDEKLGTIHNGLMPPVLKRFSLTTMTAFMIKARVLAFHRASRRFAFISFMTSSKI
jgi:hypothetical protein